MGFPISTSTKAIRNGLAAAVFAAVVLVVATTSLGVAVTDELQLSSCEPGVPAASSYGYGGLTLFLIFVGVALVGRKRDQGLAASLTLGFGVVLAVVMSTLMGPAEPAYAADPPCVFPVKDNPVRRADNVFQVTARIAGDTNTTYRLEASLRTRGGAEVLGWSQVGQRVGSGDVSGTVRLPATLQDGQMYVWYVRAVEVDGAGAMSGAVRGGRVTINEKIPDLYLNAGQVYDAGLEPKLVEQGFQVLTVRADPGNIVDVEKWEDNLGIKITARPTPAAPKTASVTYTTQKDANPPGTLTLKVTVHD